MKLMVLTAACWPTEEEARLRIWIFLRSCERFGVGSKMLRLYGCGTPQFPGYRRMKLETQLKYLEDHSEDFTHVLYTDSLDAFVVAPLAEIVDKYEAMGSPAMLAAAYTGFADSTAPEGFGEERLRYPHVGGYIAEVPVIIDAFERMLQLPHQTGDDSFNWRDAWLEGWFRPTLDSQCEIFQVTDEHCGVHPATGRLVNYKTESQPCILHLAGGYTDQVSGKDDRMKPWAERLGII